MFDPRSKVEGDLKMSKTFDTRFAEAEKRVRRVLALIGSNSSENELSDIRPRERWVPGDSLMAAPPSGEDEKRQQNSY